MTPERWGEVERIYQGAMGIAEGAEREAFVERECGGDGGLRDEVLSLIAHSGHSVSIPSIVGGVAALMTKGEAEVSVGERIGAYRITGVVGRGGMGVVCKAIRDDDEFHKQVAIKLVKRGMDTALWTARFQAERQILAGLEHPGIARLLDGGATAEGRPYFVMEYVDGIPIIDYCEQKSLGVPERLRLFRQVCESVQYAHANLVIHRDLKPQNILVTAEGMPKLLDFGLAKVLDTASEQAKQSYTVLGAAMFTPDFASPEQVKGVRAGTAADIYSLGAVLYLMLTGVKPHRLKEYTPAEIEQAICAAPLEAPSKVAPRLAKDLDNIVLKAMHKEPERRYASVEHFSQDIGRYLDGWPVEARGDRFLYRAGKFLSRNKWSSAAAGFAVLSLCAGLWATAYQARRAERRFEQTRKLAKVFLFDLNDRIRGLQGSTETRKFAIETGLEYLAALEKEGGGDRELMAELAQGYTRIGDLQGNPTQSNLGDAEAALASYGKAAAILERIGGPMTAGLRLSLADAHAGMGEVHGGRGRAEESVAALRKALAVLEPVEESGNQRVMQSVAHIHNGIARALNRAADIDNQVVHAEKALSAYRRLAEAEPDNQVFLSELSVAHRFLGTALEKRGRREAALREYRAALEIRRKLVASHPDDARHRRNLMLAYSLFGDSLRSRVHGEADNAGALAHYRPMLEIAEAQASNDAKDRRTLSDLSQSLIRMGVTLAELKRFGEADAVLRRALGLVENLMAADGHNLVLRGDRSFVKERLANSLLQQNRFAEALRYSRSAVEEAESLLADAPKSGESLTRMFSASGVHVRALAIGGDRDQVAAWSRKIEDQVARMDGAKVSSRVIWVMAADALTGAAEANERLKGRERACELSWKAAERWRQIRGPEGTPPVSAEKLYRDCPARQAKK
ncbi:MAG: protein kinase [Acidobacteria bacterium]|nr:protein kinase [Acidobacteriota bacterium]